MTPSTQDIFGSGTNWGPLVEGLTTSQREKLADLARFRKFKTKEEIARFGEVLDGVYFIVEGTLRLEDFTEDGERFLFGNLEEGDAFGLLSVLDGQPADHYTSTVGETLTAFVTAQDFRDFVFSDIELSQRMMDFLCHRLRKTLLLVGRFAPGSQQNKVARCLVQFAEHSTAGQGNGTKIEIMVNQYDLASMLSISRQSVNRILRELVLDGIVKSNYNSLQILDLPRLRLLV